MRSLWMHRNGALLAFVGLALLHVDEAAAGNTCTVRFAVPDPGLALGALSLDVDYSDANTFMSGTGTGVSCTASDFTLVSKNDIDGTPGSELLRLAMTDVQGSPLTTPAYVAECTSTGAGAGDPDSYAVSVIDSYANGSPGFSGSGICGAPHSGKTPPHVRDAYSTLNAAVGLHVCPLCECDVNNSSSVTAADALAIEQVAVGLGGPFNCGAPCGAMPGGVGPIAFVGINVSVTCNGSGCGDGDIDAGEECDDANPVETDACNYQCESPCPSTPRGDCRAAQLSKIVIKGDGSGDKDKLIWKWLKGPELLYANLPNPLSNNAYQLCLYPNETLLSEIEIPSPAGWTTLDPKGHSYLDKTATVGGVAKLQLGAGGAGKSKVSLKASGANLPLALLPATSWTIQLADTAEGSCWSSSFPTQIKNDGTLFKAKSPE